MELPKILLIILCINVMLYIGGFRTFENDILHQMIDISGQGNETYTVHGFNSNFTGTIPESPETSQALTGETGGWNLVDALRQSWYFLTFLLNIVTAPLGIFLTIEGMPPAIILLFGAPLGMLLIIGIIYFIRSGR